MSDRGDLLRAAKQRVRVLPLDNHAFREIDLALEQTETEVLRDIVMNDAAAQAADRWNNSRQVECAECGYKADFKDVASAKHAAMTHEELGYRHICIIVPRMPRIEMSQGAATPGRHETHSPED